MHYSELAVRIGTVVSSLRPFWILQAIYIIRQEAQLSLGGEPTVHIRSASQQTVVISDFVAK